MRRRLAAPREENSRTISISHALGLPGQYFRGEICSKDINEKPQEILAFLHSSLLFYVIDARRLISRKRVDFHSIQLYCYLRDGISILNMILLRDVQIFDNLCR
jgi:hypothetical protein